jgi:hypothetical protein
MIILARVHEEGRRPLVVFTALIISAFSLRHNNVCRFFMGTTLDIQVQLVEAALMDVVFIDVNPQL